MQSFQLIKRRVALFLVLTLAAIGSGQSASAQSTLSTAIPYQGQLTDGGAAANGQYDFEFKLFDATSAGSQIGATTTKDNVQVTNGLFAVELDFGGSAFTGASRFLEIGVRAGSSTGSFTALTPRRPLLAVPYALYSPSGAKPAYGMAANAPNNAAYIAANGNVGLGTTGPLHPLEIYNTNSANGAILITNPASATSEASIGFQDGDGTVWVAGVGGWTRGNDFVIGKVPDGPKLTILGNGNVGIGTTGPLHPLEIYNTNSANGAILITNPASATSEASIGFQDGDGTVWVAGVGGWTRGNDFVIGKVPDGPKLTILGNGNTGIGTTGPQRALHVNTTNSVNGAVLISNPGSATSEASIGYQDGDGTTWVAGIGAWSQGNDFVIGHVPTGPAVTVKSNGQVSVRTLQIIGGADLAEPFTVTDPEAVEPGTVVVLDADHPGQVRVSATAYDTLVAGIVSGAGGINPGLVMNQEELTIAGESHPVALTGKVYVKAVGPIKVGDLLTTSTVPGHAMAATDRDRAFGATLGKAMSNLDEGTGLVLVLVSLQ